MGQWVVDDEAAERQRERTTLEDAAYLTPKQYAFKELLTQFAYTQKGSAEEDDVLTRMFNVFVPGVVRQPKMEDDVPVDAATADIDDIDTPFSAPKLQEKTAEYVKEKQAAIEKLVSELPHVRPATRLQLKELLTKHADRLSLRGENLQQTSSTQHEINTGSAPPFRQRLRNYAPALQEIIEKEVGDMIAKGVLRPSKSPYASNLLLVRKPDPTSPGGMKNRVCADFVQLNKQTIRDSYPLPNLQWLIDKVGWAKWFTTMDLLNGFWQVMIKPEHREKTAVITTRGLYEFVVMAFGLCNAPATFQRLMDTVIAPEFRGFIETYIDDVIVYSRTEEDHLKHLAVLFDCLERHELVVKLTKCHFFQREVKFLGHILAEGQVRLNPEVTAAVDKWARPTQSTNRLKALRGFLGTVGWYRRFIPKFSDIAKPLHQLLHKGAAWEWTDACERAFIALKKAITSAPVLQPPDPNKDFIARTDASDVGLGVVLQQKDEEGHLHPVAYASRSLSPAERKWMVTEREALAIPWALTHFNTYLEGHKYTVITDHAALRYLFNNKDKTPRMYRLVAKLSPYELKVEYAPGKENHGPDLLSREEQYMEMQPTTTAVHPVTTRSRTTHGQRRGGGSGAATDQIAPPTPASVSHASSSPAPAPKSSSKQRHKAQRSNGEDYEVAAIIDKRKSEKYKNEYQYKVRWVGYSEEGDTWEHLSNLEGCMDMVLAFEKARQQEQFGVRATTRVMHSCEECGKEFDTDAQLHVHNHHHHGVALPAACVRLTEVMDKEEVARLQRAEPEFHYLYDSEFGEKDTTLTHKQRQSFMHYEYVVAEDGLLYCIELPSLRSRHSINQHFRLCVPSAMRAAVVNEVHSGALAGHPGVVHMHSQMRRRVWWPNMIRDIVKAVTSCPVCQREKKRMTKVSTQPMKIIMKPWRMIGVDIMGPLPITRRGNRYVQVAIDYYSREVEIWALPDIETQTVLQPLIDDVVCRHGLPDVILTDRGNPYVSNISEELFRVLGIQHRKSAAHHPQGNGLVERYNRTFKQVVRKWVIAKKEEWDVGIPVFRFSSNMEVHSLHKLPPSATTRTFVPQTVLDVVLGLSGDEFYSDYVQSVIDEVKETHEFIKQAHEEVNERREQQLDHGELPAFAVGDSVLVFDPTHKKGESSKLKMRWKGPFTIVEQVTAVTYRVLVHGVPRTVHAERLKKYVQDDENEETTEAKEGQRAVIDSALAHIEAQTANERVAASTSASEQQLSSSGDIATTSSQESELTAVWNEAHVECN